MSLRDKILSASDLPREEIDTTAEWGENVFVRTMTGKERDAFDSRSSKIDETERLNNFRARLAVATVTDADGNLIFTHEDADLLGGKSASAISKIFLVAARLNGLNASDVKVIKDGLKKTIQEDSSSDSPLN